MHSCSQCGAATALTDTREFDQIHMHPFAGPVVLRVQPSEASAYAAVCAKHAVILHQVAPVTSGSRAVFFASQISKIAGLPAWLVTSPNDLDSKLSEQAARAPKLVAVGR